MFKKKYLVPIVSLLLMLCVIVGTTLALLIDITPPVKNVFTPSKVTTTVEEKLEDGVKKDVQIRNTGDTIAWIRAYYIVTWKNAAGEVYGEIPKFTVDEGEDWLKGNDGFYYWPSPVAPGGLTGNLIDFIQPNGACPDSEYTLHVEIIGSGIQSTPEEAFKAWAENSGIEWGESALNK